MIRRIVPFLFLALAIQQAVSFCICRADDAFVDATVTENCSQWSDAQHEDSVLDVLNADELPCVSHLVAAPAKRLGTSGAERILSPVSHLAGWTIDLSPTNSNVWRNPVLPEFSAPAVRLPLLN